MRSSCWRALGTKAVLVVGDAAALAPAQKILAATLDAFDRACSRFRPDSELRRLNERGRSAVRVGPVLFDAIRTALTAADATDGLVDPTIGRTLRLCGYDRTFAAVRQREAAVRPSFVRDPDWRHVELDDERPIVRLPKGVELDLGATAKALAADRAAEKIFARTGCGVLVALGGDVAVVGPPPPEGWPILVADDNDEPLDAPGPTVSIASGALATSSTTVRRWMTAEGELHHVVDPRTGRPAPEFWRTVSATASSCVGANTATTAAIVLGESAIPWLTALRLPARLVGYDGHVTCVAGWPSEAA